MVKRKSNGAGNITRRKDGRYMGSIQCGIKPDGKPRRITVYGKTEREVSQKLKPYREEIKRQGSLPKISTMKDWMESWLETLKRVGNLKPRSYEVKYRAVHRFIIPALGYLQISQVTVNDVQKMINNMVDKDYSYSQIHKVCVTLSQRFKKGIVDREVTYNPVDGAILPKQPESEVSAMTQDEMRAFIAAANDKYSTGRFKTPCKDYLLLLLYTGIRVGEAGALVWSDVDFDKKTLSINKDLATVHDYAAPKGKRQTFIVQDTPKTSRSNRVIPLSKAAVKCLEDIKSASQYDLILASDTGNFLENTNLSRALKGVLKRAGISPEKYSLHSLRHTYATRLFESGIDVKVVSELLGHSTVTITYNTYIHVIQQQKAEAMDKLDTIFET